MATSQTNELDFASVTDQTTLPDFEITLQTLNFTARLLASKLDLDQLIDSSLETLLDFGQTNRGALFLLEADGKHMTVLGEQHDHEKRISPGIRFPIDGTPFERLVERKVACKFPIGSGRELLLPSYDEVESEMECICLPLVGNNNEIVGASTLERKKGDRFFHHEIQIVNIVTTLIAVTLENTRLFKLATIDGLTALYVRRYFDIRIAEEMTRHRRGHNKYLSLMMTDIDHFKSFNDTYGHQQGDTVLKELAEVLKKTVRTGFDIPCRYGGEEFAVIMPETSLENALRLAERFRKSCEEHLVPGQDKPLKVTVSAGVATIGPSDDIAVADLIKRADSLLYKSKKDGRNRISG